VTVTVPEAPTAPIPGWMFTDEAFVEDQERVTLCPALIDVGEALN